jgi:hypothetical protein
MCTTHHHPNMKNALLITIHVKDEAWVTRSVMRSAFFILGWWWVVHMRGT